MSVSLAVQMKNIATRTTSGGSIIYQFPNASRNVANTTGGSIMTFTCVMT